MTLSIMAISITTFFSKMTFTIMTLSRKGLFATLSIKDIQHIRYSAYQDILLCVSMPSAIMLNVDLLLCWLSLCWMSLCWMSLCWMSLFWMLLCWMLLCWMSLCWMSLFWMSLFWMSLCWMSLHGAVFRIPQSFAQAQYRNYLVKNPIFFQI